MHEQSQFFNGAYNKKTKDPAAKFLQGKMILKIVQKHISLNIFNY